MVNERESHRANSAFLPRKYELPRITSRSAIKQSSYFRRKEMSVEISRSSRKALSRNGSNMARNGSADPSNIFVPKVSETEIVCVSKGKDVKGHFSPYRASSSQAAVRNSRTSDGRYTYLNRPKTCNGKRVLKDMIPRKSLDERQESSSSRHRVSSLSIRQLRNMSRVESDVFGTYRSILNLRLADCRRQNYELSERVKAFVKVIENFKMQNKPKYPWSLAGL